ncbi:MAG: FHA domain-containing protein [Gammaproteobacteria bacterium]
MVSLRRILGSTIAATALLGPAGSLAAITVGAAVVLDCTQAPPATVQCDFRNREGGGIEGAEAVIGGTRLPLRIVPARAGGAGTAILFLVDTSDPGRAAVIARNAAQVRMLAGRAGAADSLGLARFDTSLEILAPVGSPAAEIDAAAGRLQATGRTTELYRNVIDAIRTLGAVPAAARVLVVFSDGLAEDVAYRHEDAVRAADQADVVVYGLGFPRDVPRSVGLQSLRRLAEETGGRFVESDAGFDLPPAFTDAPFTGLVPGGTFSIDLGPAIRAGLAGPQRLQIALRAAGSGETLTVPVQVAAAPALREAAAAQAAAPPVAAAAPGRTVLESWIWFGTPAAFLAVVVAALYAYARISQRQQRHAAPPAPVSAPKPFAWLVRIEDESVRHPISHSPWRIGRGRNNDLTVDDQSVSRQHAEIHRRHDGSFTVVDLESLNGVFVNEKKVRRADIAEGDSIDIGDVPFRFTLYDEDSAAQDPTVMVRTRTPGPRLAAGG